MKRLTTDHPQENFETMLKYVFAKDGWAHIRHDGEREDVPLTDWAKAQCIKRDCICMWSETAKEIDEALCGCLMDGEGCPVALAYCFACQASHLRDRLKAIEDILGEEYDLDHLRGLHQAEKDGRLVVPPCKVGDLLYEVDLPEYGVITCKALSIMYYKGPMFHVPGNEVVSSVDVEVEVIEGHGKGSSYNFEIGDFGKTVFLTRREAEEALSHE